MLKAALVLWSGDLGGAQVFTAQLAAAMRKLGVDARVVFVGGPRGLAASLAEHHVPVGALGLPRGRMVTRAPRRFARLLNEYGSDCAILVSSGYMAGALRVGGYRGAIVAVEHGTLLQSKRLNPLNRAVRMLDRRAGLWACDVEVAVSSYMLDVIKRTAHARRVTMIPNGVDLERFHPATAKDGNKRSLVVGCATRLIASKGVDDLIRACAILGASSPTLRIAGEGPDLPRLRSLARAQDALERVEFLDRVDDMPSFWQHCDLAVVPSRDWIESFSLSAVEAMACGLPVIAARAGALTEVIDDGHTGRLVPPGDINAIADALNTYLANTAMRNEHGRAARKRCEECYDLQFSARQYVDLCHEVVAATRARRPGEELCRGSE